MSKSSNVLLIIIDIQEKLVSSMPNKNHLIWNIRRLVDAANLLKINIIISEQNPNRLGRSEKQIRDKINGSYISKMDFSCANEYQITNHIKESKVDTIFLCGVESHVCVQQTALDFVDKDLKCFVIVDATQSRTILDKNISEQLMQSYGALLTTTEAAIFQWCKTADRPEFKSISNLIKEVQPEDSK